MRKQVPVDQHVRYVVTLLRTGPDKRRYAVMKINIEVADASNQPRVWDILSRAVKRELSRDKDQTQLIADICNLVWEWLESVRQERQLPVVVVGNVLLSADSEIRYPFDGRDCLQVSIFTKEDEARVDKLFTKMLQRPRLRSKRGPVLSKKPYKIRLSMVLTNTQSMLV